MASKQHKNHVLITNQNALDLFSCIFLVISYLVKLSDIRLSGWIGYWLCMLIVTENFLWCGIYGSVINLAIIAVERYLKVVHYAWSKLNLRNWMIYLAMAFAWIGSIVYTNTLVFSTCTVSVINGVCNIMVFSSESLQLFWSIWDVISFYVIILLIFIFCYGRILLVVRRQAKIMSRHAAAGSNTSQTHNHIQTNIIKTMILVCGFYAVMWLPNHIIALVMALSPNPYHYYDSGYYASSMFIAFLYMCTNPFIYATKFDPVKEILLLMIPCKKTSNPAAVNVVIA